MLILTLYALVIFFECCLCRVVLPHYSLEQNFCGKFQLLRSCYLSRMELAGQIQYHHGESTPTPYHCLRESFLAQALHPLQRKGGDSEEHLLRSENWEVVLDWLSPALAGKRPRNLKSPPFLN